MAGERDTADATQEALIAIVRGLPRFDGRSSFTTWAYRVATNACLDELRRRRRRPPPLPDDVLDVIADPQGAADEMIGERLAVDAALARLTPDFRAAVVLRDLVGLDYAEIGAILGLPPGTVRSRISRGRAALADQLGNSPTAAGRPTP